MVKSLYNRWGLGSFEPGMTEGKRSRRSFIQAILATVSGLLAIAPFSEIVRYLRSRGSAGAVRQKIANINDLPPNNRLVFTYPVTGDPERDKDPFRKFLLIKLPDGTLKAYSMVCVHLWCLVDYKPERRQIECPCHGSIYDPETGVAFKGPAAAQPNKTLPEVKLEIDENGDIYAVGVVGVIGYGREAAGS